VLQVMLSLGLGRPLDPLFSWTLKHQLAPAHQPGLRQM
jgi:hypothetical protein